MTSVHSSSSMGMTHIFGFQSQHHDNIAEKSNYCGDKHDLSIDGWSRDYSYNGFINQPESQPPNQDD